MGVYIDSDVSSNQSLIDFQSLSLTSSQISLIKRKLSSNIKQHPLTRARLTEHVSLKNFVIFQKLPTSPVS